VSAPTTKKNHIQRLTHEFARKAKGKGSEAKARNNGYRHERRKNVEKPIRTLQSL
jgi:hypothetical protein